ncbi:MAG TPA: head GIN domain-containing protein [Anaerolineae bacterium]|nr:head GIN domain-containing protein [Anaerolineae bacterium]
MWYRIALSIIALLTFGLYGCARFGGFNVTSGSGNVTTQTREVSGFSAVSLTWLGEMTITQGDSEGLTIEAEDNILPLITTRVENGKLIIGLVENLPGSSVVPTKPVKYNLQVKALNSIEISGAGNVSAIALKGDSLRIQTSGAGNVNIGQLDTNQVNTNTSGAGNVTLAGRADTQQINLSGFGNYSAGDLKSNTATVSVSGAGNATLWVAQSLNVQISGAGNVNYYGSPQVTQNISGIGNIKSLGNK